MAVPVQNGYKAVACLPHEGMGPTAPWSAADAPSLARLPAAHLLLGGLAPNRLWTGTTAWGLGTPAIGDAAFSTSGTSYPQRMDSLQQGFSTSAPLIFLDRIILCRGDSPVHLECLAYLSKSQQPTPFPIITVKSVSKHCQLYSGGGGDTVSKGPATANVFSRLALLEPCYVFVRNL